MAATNAAKAAAAKNNVISDSKEIVEDVKELVDDGVELIEDSVELVKKQWIVPNQRYLLMSALAAGVVIGSAATFLAVRKRLATKYQKLADEQIADVKEHYSATRLIDKKPDLEELAEKSEAKETVAEIIEQNGYVGYNKVETTAEAPQGASQIVAQSKAEPVVEEPVVRNVFESDKPGTYFDFDEESKRREEFPNDPYVITFDEFNENETDYEQASLTYYDGDDVLVDSKDAPVDDVDKTIGVENLLRFGHGSGDPKIVYIRNNRLGLDIEVAHSDGKYAKEVLGFDGDSLRHSDDRRNRRFRDRHDG